MFLIFLGSERVPYKPLNTDVKRIKENKNVEVVQELLGAKLIVYVEWEHSKRKGRPYILSAHTYKGPLYRLFHLLL